MAKDINSRILQLQVDTKELLIQFKKLNQEGQSAEQIFEKLGDKFKNLVTESDKIAESSKRSFSQTKNLEEYKNRLTKINSSLTSISSSYNSMQNSAKKANDVYQEGFRLFFEQDQKLKRLQEEISLQQIQLSKKTTAEKLQDTVTYYERLQKEYKEDTEEYLKLEKKKLDARIRLERELDDVRLKKRKADVEAAVRSETEERKRRESIQKRWDDRRLQREKQESDKRKRIEEIEIQNSIAKFKIEAAKHKEAEREKTNTEKKEASKREAEEKKRDFGGGFRSQLTPRAIGGALGSLTKYLGLYQAINAAQRLFTELTIGSARQAIAFEKALANLGAVAGATSEEVSMLGKNALSVAGATKFTAEEIVGLQTELSKLGFSADDVVSATQGIAFAAQALGAPLDAVAQQTGKVINQFDLLIEQAGFVGDVLVTAINNSALSFDSFGTAIQYVGPIAKNLGLTFEQTAGAMAVLADSGFTASRIGTGLRGIFTELGKTSADVEASLKSLAGQNISLSEAVDLVGKRNAAQLITLLKNIDAIDEGNSKYYEQGRALESAAKQANSFSGQMDILTSNFREFQIEIGKVIVESDLLLGVLDAFFPKGAKTARGFQVINEIGFKSFNEGAKEVSDGADATTVALDKLGITLEEFTKSSEMAGESWFKTWTRFFTGNLTGIEEESVNAFDDAVALTNKVIGLRNKLQEQSEEGIRQQAITEGQTIATNDYEEAVRKLTQAFENQINVNDEVDAMAASINSQMTEYQGIIDSGTTSVYNFITGRYDMVELTEEEILKYKGLVGALQGYLDQLTNISFNEDELNKKRQKEKKDAIRKEREDVKERIKLQKDITAQEIAEINERAKIESSRPSVTAAELADIENERQILVSEAYKKKAAAIAEIIPVYEENIKIVEEATKAAEKQAEILGSEVINDAAKAFKNYSSEFDKIKQSYIDGNIGLDEYRQKLDETQSSFDSYIETLIATNSVSEEVAKVLRELSDSYRDVSSATEETSSKTEEASEKTKEAKKDWEDFKEEFKDTLWADIASKAVDALGESLGAFNDTTLENTKNRLDQELDAVASRYDIEADILKSQLDNQLITESQYRTKQKELRKAQIAEENSLNKQIFEAEQKQDRNDAGLEGLEAAAQAYIEAFKNYEPATAIIVGSIGAGIAAAQASAQIAAINQRKFFPKKFAEGGVVSGPSHEQGGVPFTVQGQSGYEMEGGEYIVNKRATAMHRDLLERINKSGRTNPTVGKMKFAEGGLVSTPASESVDYLKAIAEATTSTAIGVSKPVRAYVADKDLRGNATERRIRDRNDRI